MAQKREIEETELKFPDNIPVCAPIPASRSPDISDRGACDRRNCSSAASPTKSDPAPPGGGEGLRKRPREATRCSGSGCRKRIGLIGFRCRCGDVFCSEHRYSDRHDCSFDYKAAGREAIARENPVVRAAKLLKV
ncbi:zinc finger A20 and AN1 domain-containing stress-associated protein 5-like [Andrographis paniculata]|uniref:zinc finger A20 and AN1 domain-containing stress-associated protein 5-like n=1 Tax=Andrographis paniculata TaxID=175694 RepID=UPI0021E8CDDC|nr:zinc finger A20 and AN1 domain-containing stress-associated protein 5-like [Andrographis paniculata]